MQILHAILSQKKAQKAGVPVTSKKLRALIQCALFAALMALGAWITVPFGQIGFTMQTFVLFLTLGLLGGQKGCAACTVYLLLGAVGLPVFHGFQGGAGVLLGPTGGYLAGFLAASAVYGVVTALLGRKLWVKGLAMVLGCLTCYAFGTLWFFLAYTGGAGLSLGAVLAKCVLPYLLPDTLKLALALALTGKLSRFCR